MAAEHGGHRNNEGIINRKNVGRTLEVGLVGVGAYELIVAGLFWPAAIGGGIYLLAKGLMMSKRKGHSAKSGHGGGGGH